jgi:MinD superfamily P-loop ATPase
MLENNISIAFASGKGGTGKTSLAVNFAKYLSQKKQVILVDLDVEEPNTGIFFTQNKTLYKTKESTIDMPFINAGKCSYCRACVEKCNFNAIAVYKNNTSVFFELCKGCGRCKNICKTGAIDFNKYKIGKIDEYTDENLSVIEGKLDIGNIHTKSLIKDVKKHDKKEINIYDCPPGTTCPMVESIADADFVVLVTEPTPFGLHDLSLAVEVVQKLNKKLAVLINKSNYNDALIEAYCSENKYSIIGKIPFDRTIAQKCGLGECFYNEKSYPARMEGMYDFIIGAMEC